jgi:hypothetical protein
MWTHRRWTPYRYGKNEIYDAAMKGDYELVERLYRMGAPEAPGTLEDLFDRWFESLGAADHWIGVSANLGRCIKIVTEYKHRVKV